MHLKMLQKEQFKKQQAYGDLIGNYIADKIIKVLKPSPQNISETIINEEENIELDREIPGER